MSKELEKSTGFDEQTLEEIRLFKKKFVVKEKENSEFKGKIISDLNLLKANKQNQLKVNEEFKISLIELKSRKESEVEPNKKYKTSPEPNPKHVADFMSLFNQRKGLKYLTHDYDENDQFGFDKFLIAANDVFQKETKKLNIPQSLWRIVKQFAFDSQQTSWTSISEDYQNDIPIKIGWATPELRKWSKQNNLHPIRNVEYKKIINDFRRITRIEPKNLEKLIDASLKSAFENEIENYKIKRIDLSKADFYSHVRFLKDAIKIIFEEIKKRSDSSGKKEVTIKYERSISNEGYYLRRIKITHHNSFPTKELGLYLKEWQEKGNMGKIKEKLRGYCHWSVETIIEETPTKVNILKEKETKEYEIINCKKEDAPEGFTHILTFYYK